MSCITIELPKKWLAPGEDIDHAKMIEAGCYAQHLLDTGADRPGLSDLLCAAERSRAALWAVGMRIAMKQAVATAAAQGINVDDLFQDGCLAIAQAIERYDYRRQTRFTTFAYECVARSLSEAAKHRLGRPPASRNDRRAAAQALRIQETAAQAGTPVSLSEAAARAGVTLAAVLRGLSSTVPLEEALTIVENLAPDEQVSEALDFLQLLPRRLRNVLELRFGLVGQKMTLADIAYRHRTSASTVARWEREALLTARKILSGEWTRVTAQSLSQAQ